jgi:hypothetical protein
MLDLNDVGRVQADGPGALDDELPQARLLAGGTAVRALVDTDPDNRFAAREAGLEDDCSSTLAQSRRSA